MRQQTDQSNQNYHRQVVVVCSKHVTDKVNHRSSHQDEEHEHRDHHKEEGSDGVEEEAEGNDHDSYPLGPFEAILFIEGKVFVGSEDIDADGKASEAAGDEVGNS